jgi:AcrR family transcriptional regulator
MNDQTLKQIQEDAARQAILNTARSIIVKNGAGSLSMRGLAKQVGCSPATIYKYFENKDDMLEAIRQEGWRLMNDLDVEEDQPDLPILQRLELLSQIFQKFPSRHPEHYLLMFGSIDAAPMSIQQVLQDEGHLALAALLQQSIEAGEIKPDQYTPQQLALLIWFLSHGVAMLNLTIFREDDEFLTIANEVLLTFAKTLIKEH